MSIHSPGCLLQKTLMVGGSGLLPQVEDYDDGVLSSTDLSRNDQQNRERTLVQTRSFIQRNLQFQWEHVQPWHQDSMEGMRGAQRGSQQRYPSYTTDSNDSYIRRASFGSSSSSFSSSPSLSSTSSSSSPFHAGHSDNRGYVPPVIPVLNT